MTKQMKWESIDLLKDLISFRSITPDDKGCQNYLIEKLRELEFEIKILILQNIMMRIINIKMTV